MDTEIEELFAIREYHHSPDGILATILGSVSVLVFIVLAVLCMHFHGEAGMWAGSIGITAFVLAFIGMVRGLRSFQDHCSTYRLSKIGTLMSGVMVAVWFLTYCVGLSS